MTPAYLGEFEHLLLLTVLRLGADAYGADIARDLEERAGRAVTRGALYTSLDRLEDKGLVRWKAAAGTPARNGLPRRVYAVTPAGVAALRESRTTLQRMWRGLEHLLKDPAS
jgi:PadR family transcriptional regulator PadR